MIADEDEVTWNRIYTLVKRKCARCTMCGRCCERSGEHRLCAHDTKKSSCRTLWHIVNEQKSSVRISVQGYCNGAGLDQKFSEMEIEEELNAITEEFQAL